MYDQFALLTNGLEDGEQKSKFGELTFHHPETGLPVRGFVESIDRAKRTISFVAPKDRPRVIQFPPVEPPASAPEALEVASDDAEKGTPT